MTQVIKPLIFEEWKPFIYDKVTPGMYEVSNIGRVRNNKGHILKEIKLNSGYYAVRFYKDKPYRFEDSNRYKIVTTHRAVMTTFCPIKNPNEMTINHNDGDSTNNCILNLEWVTQKENNSHAFRTGLNNNYCENAYQAKLTNQQVIRICELLQEGNHSYSEILTIIGLDLTDNNKDMIGNVKRRIAWTRISDNYIW